MPAVHNSNKLMEVGRTKTQSRTIILPITDNVAIIHSSVHHYRYVMLDLRSSQLLLFCSELIPFFISTGFLLSVVFVILCK